MANDANHHALIDAIPHIVWTASETGAIASLNRKWTEVTGLSHAQGLGWEFLQAIHSEDRDRIQAAWQQAVASRQPYEARFRIRQASGKYTRVIARAQIERTKDSSPVEWVGTFTDIESVMYRKDDLIHKQQFLEALLENLSDGIVACDASGTLTLMPPAKRFMGYPQNHSPPSVGLTTMTFTARTTPPPCGKQKSRCFAPSTANRCEALRCELCRSGGKRVF